MKVAPKLAMVAWLAFLPVLGMHAWLSVRREQSLFQSDLERGLSLLGEHLRQVVVTEWARSGEPEGEAILSAVARTDRDVEIRWLPEIPPGAQRGLSAPQGDRVTWLEPIAIEGNPIAGIELSESLKPMHRYLRATLVRIGLLSVALAVASLVLAHAVGQRVIGRRLQSLVEFAKRTGAGRLGERIDLAGRDEISALATSLGDMSGQLAESRRQAEAANAERLAMLQQLRHADRLTSIGRLAGGVAHELGTPLNVVMGHAKRIAAASSWSEETRRSAETIHRQMDRMAATIRNILGFVRRSNPPVETLDLVAVVESVRELLAPLLAERRVEIVSEAKMHSALVRGSRIQLEQAISNLIANAVDATGADGRVEIAIERTNGGPRIGRAPWPMIAVRVRDQGAGVPEECVERIFEPFFTSKPAGSGTGLGLWITQGIAHDHGGRIEFANLPGGGACFTMMIPECGGT